MKRRSPYIVSPGYDWAFFLAPPLGALILGIAISHTALTEAAIDLGAGSTTGAAFLIGAIIHAHLVAVLARSHGNAMVFGRHPLRFVVVPILLFVAIVMSEWIAIASMIVATFWDVWHSGAQTFGFGRIYDRNAGARSPGRKLDFWMNQLLYAGPILGGVTLMDHLDVLGELEAYDDPFSTFLILVPAHAQRLTGVLTWIVVVAGCALIGVYVLLQWRLARRGHPPSPLKVWLVASTGLTSIVTWGFNSWGEAFFIMNLFHAVQYLALVWATEGTNLTRRLRLDRRSYGRRLTLAIFLGAVFGYGCAVELLDPGLTTLWAVTMVVSLMHFWYDAFVWSVRRGHV
ncbi:MAG: hypothetical protein AB7S26_18625 [Sandaracinaceae bacterium]